MELLRGLLAALGLAPTPTLPTLVCVLLLILLVAFTELIGGVSSSFIEFGAPELLNKATPTCVGLAGDDMAAD